MKKILLLLMVGFMLTACNVRVSDNVNVNRFEKKMSYFQDQNTGAVFAVITIKTGINALEDGVGIAYIPKSDITEAIKAKIPNYKEYGNKKIHRSD